MTRLPRAVEKAIFERDKGICQICGRKTEFGDGEIDHKISSHRDGRDDPENLQWTCHRCNKLKGKNRSNEQVRKTLGLPEDSRIFNSGSKLGTVTLTPRINIQTKLRHSKYILLTRSDYQGLENWAEENLIENLLKQSKDRLETSCLMQHFETGYGDEIWFPLMKYKDLMEKYDYPFVPLPSRFQGIDIGYEQSLIDHFERIPENDRKQLMESKEGLLTAISELIFGVKNGVPLKGKCDFC